MHQPDQSSNLFICSGVSKPTHNEIDKTDTKVKPGNLWQNEWKVVQTSPPFPSKNRVVDDVQSMVAYNYNETRYNLCLLERENQ